ncbi:MAG: hypothetical protein R3C49_10060 [Planctomycetaceae bacterium]
MSRLFISSVLFCLTVCGVRAESDAVRLNRLSRQETEEILNRPCPELDFPGESPLPEILEMIKAFLQTETHTQIRFVFHTSELSLNSVVDMDSVLVHNFYVPGGSQTILDCLDDLTRELDDAELVFIPEAGRILVTTASWAESDDALETRVYRQTDFLPLLMSGRDDSGGTVSSARTFDPGPEGENLIQLIVDQTQPTLHWYMLDGEGGTISWTGQYVVIRQTYAGHRHVLKLLQSFRHPEVITGEHRRSNEPAGSGKAFSESVLPAMIGWVVALLLAIAMVLNSSSRR